MSNITLTSSMRSNLLSLKNIGVQLDKTQQRLSTGLKVNSAIDNASSYYQSRALSNRAADLNNLLDSMGQGIQTIQAATKGLEAGASFLEQASVVAAGALSTAPVVPLQNCAKLTNNVEELLAQGYKAISSVDDLKAAIAAENSGKRYVLTQNINISETLTFAAKDITINGGGNKLTITSSNYLKFDGENTEISNMEIDVTNTWGYLCLSFTGKDSSVKDVSFNTTVEMKNVYWRAITSTGKGMTIENVDVNAKGASTELIGVYASNQTSIKNFSMNANMQDNDGTIVGIAARNGSDISLDDIGIDIPQ